MEEKDSSVQAIVAAIKDAVRKSVASPYTSEDIPLALHEPCFQGNENAYVKECIDTGWVSSVGKFVDRFEEELAAYTGVQRAVAVSNGTAALHMALLLAGVKADDEVLVPALTFVATANAVSYLGAFPHFVDSEETTLGLDAEKLDRYLSVIGIQRDGHTFNKATGRRISVILPMHTFGHPADLDALIAVAEKYRLTLVEDAAESIGSVYKGRHTGNFGKIAALSFNGNKTITTGGGGALLTNDEDLGRLAKHLTTQAKVPHAWEFVHDAIGYNYRMPNINAALGCAQLEELDGFLRAQRRLADRYEKVFAPISGVRFVKEPSCARSNYWLQAICLDGADFKMRDAVISGLHAVRIFVRPAWRLLYKLPMFERAPRMDCVTAERIEAALINLPSSVRLGRGILEKRGNDAS